MFYALNKRLRGPHPNRPPPEILSEDELKAVIYDDIDVTANIPKQPTHKGYVVVGGSGWMANYLVQLLLKRGETSIRIVDISSPAPGLLDNKAVTFVKADISSLPSVEAALLAPFPSTGKPPSVIYHCAANIRFMERASYTYHESYRVNVQGTHNVIEVAKMLPEEAILVYTCSSDIVLPRPRFMRLGKDHDHWPYNTVVVSDDDPLLEEHQRGSSCYGRSKTYAEHLVLKANGDGLRTGSIRPGQTITGPNDRMICSTLTLPRVPVFDNEWSHTNVCVWDVVAAHLLLEDALDKHPQDVGGEAYLVTGKNQGPWTMRENRNAVQFYASKKLVFDEIPVLLIFIIAHLVEAFLFFRYHFLLPFFSTMGTRPTLTPKWMGNLVFMQPSTLEYMRDVVIDDSRARKVLGYRPQWSTAQSIKYSVDQVQSGYVSSTHGIHV
ncbi:NAD(P)-binding protein [Irpex rosettiformis]|uniref:NAD(P)-binding protein n=1 Tax=Irpex rosettiformis TaxID=378272 RepID=A0ACB8TWM2_9APHY|nr:NAD(P)-binding protein [Irpex rosettiformis]